jgi:ABC transporter substrate binding protein
VQLSRVLGLPFNQGVVGSSPTRLTKNYENFRDTSPAGTSSCAEACAETLVDSVSCSGGSTSSSTATAARRLIRREVAVAHRHGDGLVAERLLHGNAPQVRHAQDAARALGVRLQILRARGPSEIDSAFVAMTHEQAGGVIVLVDAVLQNNRARVTNHAARHRLPAVYGLGEYAEAGGLLAYGPNRLDMFRHAATYADQILKGAKPGDLPVEQPNKFALIINLKTAKALGLTIPQSLLVRADEVIQ